jgi:hypothetical protein
MRVVTKKIGFHKMVSDEASVFRRRPCCFKELVTNLSQRIWIEAGHFISFRSSRDISKTDGAARRCPNQFVSAARYLNMDLLSEQKKEQPRKIHTAA